MNGADGGNGDGLIDPFIIDARDPVAAKPLLDNDKDDGVKKNWESQIYKMAKTSMHIHICTEFQVSAAVKQK